MGSERRDVFLTLTTLLYLLSPWCPGYKEFSPLWLQWKFNICQHCSTRISLLCSNPIVPALDFLLHASSLSIHSSIFSIGFLGEPPHVLLEPRLCTILSFILVLTLQPLHESWPLIFAASAQQDCSSWLGNFPSVDNLTNNQAHLESFPFTQDCSLGKPLFQCLKAVTSYILSIL